MCCPAALQWPTNIRSYKSLLYIMRSSRFADMGYINVLEFDRGNVRMPWTVEIGKQNFKCMIKIKRQDSFAVMQSVLAF